MTGCEKLRCHVCWRALRTAEKAVAG
jgi:hypothetical protein